MSGDGDIELANTDIDNGAAPSQLALGGPHEEIPNTGAAASVVDAPIRERDMPAGTVSVKRSRVGDSTAAAAVAVAEMERLHVAATAKAKAKSKANGAPAPRATKKATAKGSAAAVVMKRPAKLIHTRRPSCPAIGDSPLFYLGGKISESTSKKGWRVWKDATCVSGEKTIKFGEDRKVSFVAACTVIEG